jgi:hypothetical protein
MFFDFMYASKFYFKPMCTYVRASNLAGSKLYKSVAYQNAELFGVLTLAA